MPSLARAAHERRFSRRIGPVDAALSEIDRALQVLSGAATASRPYPARKLESAETLSTEEQRRAAGLMRVNHVGEVCAQALYRGQAAACKDAPTRELLLHAAAEEVDHLAWCNTRLGELRSHPSVLNPFWYLASFSMGVAASFAGTRRNLGFMAETERQVEEHLDAHLKTLPPQDQRSRSIVLQMRDDEINHRRTAERAGALPMPALGRWAMRAMSRVMTGTAYYF
jgi:ubiquinone biosynthesis monooxygenase Coq7